MREKAGICAGESGDLCGRRWGFVREKAGICMGEGGNLRREKTGAAAEKNGNHAGDRMDKKGRIVYNKVWWRKAMYTFESRVRYSELDENGRLSLEGIMNYFQDCSTFQSEELGLGISHLAGRKRAWWLSAWLICLKRQPRLGERIRISTWPHGFKGIYGYRNFQIADGEGRPLIQADSTWFFYDLENGRPARVSEEERTGYGEEPALSLPALQGKIRIPQERIRREAVTVARHHLDSNHHVNNAQYAAIARELLPEGFAVGTLRVEYRRAAVLGDVMIPEVARVPEGYVISFRDQEDNPFANLWMAEKREDE